MSDTRCKSCGYQYNPCAVRKCPKSGQAICRYCCKKCPESYIAKVGEGCREWDRRRENETDSKV